MFRGLDVKNNYIKLIIVYSLLIFLYLMAFGPLTSIEGKLYQYQDFLFLTLGSLYIISAVFIKEIRKRLYQSLNISKSIEPKNIFISIGIFLLLMIFFKQIILIDPLASSSVKSALNHNFTSYFSPVLIFAMITIGPIWEESYFRGMLIGGLKEKMPLWLCILISAILFALLHPLYPLFGLILALSYSVIFLYTRSLLLSMLVHIGWNVFYIFYNYLWVHIRVILKFLGCLYRSVSSSNIEAG